MTIIRGSEVQGRSQRLVGPEVGATNISCGIAVFPPGRAIPLHTHDVEEVVVILSGEATCVLDEGTQVLHAQDTSYLPAGIPHCFRNDSAEPMSFIWIYAGVNVERHVVERPAS